MTREESYEYRRAVFHDDYTRHREHRLAYAADYYQKNKEKIIRQQVERNRMKRAGEWKLEPPAYKRPSTEACEELLPLKLKMMIGRLREQFLAINIIERPTYDYFLRCKTIEYLRNYERERRKYDHPDIIKPEQFATASEDS